MKKLSINLIYFLMCIIIFFVIIVSIYKRQNHMISKSFILKGQNIITLNINENYTDEGFIALIDKKDYSNKVKVSTNLNTKKVGTYTIVYKLKIPFAEYDLIRTINVIDNIPPELNIEGSSDIYFIVNTNYKIPIATAYDNNDGDISKNILVTNNIDITKKGQYHIDYFVKDSSGNQTTKRINVYVGNKDDYTYIDVSIKNQKLIYYENNIVKYTTDITTGINNKTIPGRYKILNKKRNTYLTTKKYNVFVNYWIAYSGNVYGLHDASWRKKFGGKEYINNGSNGCINLPFNAAKYIYENVKIGTPVIIHY